MRHALIFTFLLLTCAHGLFAQELVLKGVLRDKGDSTVLRNATVRLSSPEDAAFRKQAITNASGAFELTGLSRKPYILTISFVGYGELTRAIMLQAETQDLGTIYMPKSSRELKEVVIKGQVPPSQQKGDTLQYNADAYKVNPDASGEDLVKKMPGITVENGTVKAGGEDVKKITVDGKEFFGDDATLALRNLPAEVISKIEVFDRMSDQARFTGFDDGNSVKAINIVTRAEMRQGQFGRVYAGYGTDGRYSAGGNVNLFKDDKRISIIGLANNVNQQNFSSQDLLGVQNAGGGGRGGGRGGRGGGRGGGGFGGGGSNFMVGQQNGLNTTNSFGTNFNDNWGKKVTFSGSYFFNNATQRNSEISRVQTAIDSITQRIENDTATSGSTNYNHRINARVEYNIDSSNTIIFTPSISFQKNSGFSNSFGNTLTNEDLMSTNAANSDRVNSGYNLNGNLLYRHAFAKRGRTISVGLGLSTNDRTGETFTNSDLNYIVGKGIDDSLRQRVRPLSNGQSFNVNVSYTEPVGKSGQLQVSYNPSWSKNSSDRKAYEYDYDGKDYTVLDPSQSNLFSNKYNTQAAGLTYRLGNRDKMLSVGVNYQYAEMETKREYPTVFAGKQSFQNILPNAMLMYKLSDYSRLRIFYRSSTNQPSIDQLQDVYIYSGLTNVRIGNPNLRQQFGHMVAGRYNYTNTANGNNFFANLFVQTNQDYIANGIYTSARDSLLTATDTLKAGGRLTKAMNMDGYFSARSFFTYGVPLKFIKSNFNMNAGLGYVRTPGVSNYVEGFSHNYNYSLGAVVSSNISEYVDFTVSYNANFNVLKNTIDPRNNANYSTHNAAASVNLLSKNGWVVQNEVNHTFTKGLGDGFDQRFWLWNAAVGKKFLKNQRGELRLSVFDLLKQNRSVSRTMNGLEIIDEQNQVLTQYFMLTFTYRLRNFGKLKMPEREERGNFRERFDRGGNRGDGPPGSMQRNRSF
ncbi:outer membrane beta-barrel protein [Chitinophaga alhagiae]|uniref:outer membrane beta-barrel protein n=1 Tax=Chitinophaga alhagiae TaxID=2203219 RepID=UPI000E5AC562|nr:outer membrane beta-barrel protein [Chitinophaga alhagiae]